NINSKITINALKQNELRMSQAMERLSTGLRINSSADDAAGNKIANRMTAQIQGLEGALVNAQHAISMVETAEGSTVEVSNILLRMRELAVASQNGTFKTEDRAAMDVEFTQLQTELERIADDSQFNGTNILDGDVGSSGTVTFQIGANSGQSITVAFGEFETAETAGVFGGAIDEATIAVDTSESAAEALTAIDTAIAGVDEQRATFGAALTRLNMAVDNLSNTKINVEASRSRVQDTDYATETAELARTQIIAQAGIAMLAQANMQPQSVLALLQG
ncbi:MAG: flagellin, partial [Pseudomonadota bacterium]|nr:flagellin [Pseudomonadota bacterium]